MRLAVISDIHANLPALRAVLRDVKRRGLDRVVCLGDVVSFGPEPAECVEELGGLEGAVFVRGNHDRYLSSGSFRTAAFRDAWPAGFVGNEEWTHTRLAEPHLRALGAWPASRVLDLGGTQLTLVHATLASDEYLLWPTAPDEEVRAALGEGGLRACGHVHMQHSRKIADTLYFNPGSVGFPFDRDWRAAYAIVGDGSPPVVELVRVEYPRDQVVRSLEALRPPWLEVIRPSLQQALSFFSPDLVGAAD